MRTCSSVKKPMRSLSRSMTPTTRSCEHQRHGDLGADVGMGGDIARVGCGIVHAHGLAGLGGGAGDALAERDVVDIHALVVAAAEAVPQHWRSRSTSRMLKAS